MLNIKEIKIGQDVFIYGFGLVGKWLCSNFNPDSKIKGFIDTDHKKVGKTFNGYTVFSPQQASEICNKNSVLLITVIDIHDVFPIIKTIPHQNWVSLGIYLNNTKAINNPTDESQLFIEYALKAVEDCHKGFLSKDKLFLRSVDLVITEKCSLKCKDCSNLMQYFDKPVNISYEELLKDFDDLTKSVDAIYEIRLIGGEPFMNKDIYKIIKYVTASPKISKLVVYTNATIPIKEDQAETLRNPKVVFSVTDYGALSKSVNKVIDSLKAMGVAYRNHPPENWTDSGTIEDFERSIEDQKQLFSDCCGKNLLTVTDGKLYRCPFAANADRLSAVPKNKLNYVSASASQKEIRKYVAEIEYLPACNFCKGRSFGSPEIVPAVQALAPLKYKKFLTD